MIHSVTTMVVHELFPPRVFLRLRFEVGVLSPATSRLLAAEWVRSKSIARRKPSQDQMALLSPLARSERIEG